MTSLGVNEFTDSTGLSIGNYADPMRLWVHSFSPRDLKQLFRWTEYLYYNSAQIYAGVKKFAEYPVTEINYLSDSEKLVSATKRLLEDILGIKRALIRASLDLQVYGNSFTSIHLPFKRYLKCSNCSFEVAVSAAEYTYKPTAAAFNMTCSECKITSLAEVKDRMILEPEEINIIRWDPKLIDISANTVTGDNEYYFSIPSDIKSAIYNGDRHLIETMPLNMLQTVAEDQLFKFNKNEIFHMKSDSPSGLESGWGYPSLTSAIHLFYHASILRKANESIALERMVPLRVMHPQAVSGAADPIMSLSMGKFMGEVEENIKRWRRDPNHIMMSPVAIGVAQVGGEGRSLMVSQEISQAEDNIIASMGIPKEFIYGGLSFSGSSVTLRMLENQLEPSTFQLNQLLKWISDKCSNFLGWERIKVKLGDFRMIDDMQQRQMAMQLWQAGVISKTTLAEMNGIDINEEREKIKTESLSDARNQKQVELEMQALQQDIGMQARQMAQQQQQQQMGTNGLTYDQQAVIGQADGIAQQFMQMDPSTRKSQLASLQSEDYVMYSVVIQRLEQLQLDQKNQAYAQMQGAGQPM
jgi:hypothetical protein